MGELLSDSETNNSSDAQAANVTQITFDGNLLSTSFRSHSAQVVTDVIRYICGDAVPSPCKSATIMRNLVDDLLQSRLDSMRQLANRLDVQCVDDIVLLDSVATAMFDDDVVSWGRIVSLFAFAAYLARHCEERGLYDCSDTVVTSLNSIIVDRLGLWILANGGWESFEHQFPAICLFEPSILWKAAGFLVLLCGAAFAFYTSVQFVSPGHI